MAGSRSLDFVSDVSDADWIAASLKEVGEGVALCSVLPAEFERYARILHPAWSGRSSENRSWSDVAATSGRRMHPRVQFDSLIGVSRYEGHRDWEAEIGTLSPELWAALSGVLSPHTSDPGRCRFALWDGWGWEDGQRTRPPAFPPEVLRGPRLSLAGRDYFLLEGPLDSWPSLFVGSLEHDWQSPQVCWPPDRGWCVATEIDFDSTYVGGSPALVTAVLEDPRFEAYPAQPTDRVDAGGDELNGLP